MRFYIIINLTAHEFYLFAIDIEIGGSSHVNIGFAFLLWEMLSEMFGQKSKIIQLQGFKVIFMMVKTKFAKYSMIKRSLLWVLSDFVEWTKKNIGAKVNLVRGIQKLQAIFKVFSLVQY